MDLDDLEVFLVLAEELHFTRTAERLRLTTPQVSRVIAALERRVGGQLFQRTSRRVDLTPLGEYLRERLAPAYRAMAAALVDARTFATGVCGVLRLAFAVTGTSPVTEVVVSAFERQHPDCTVTLEEIPLFQPFVALRAGDVDAVVNWQVLDEPDLVIGPTLERRERVLAMAATHPWATRSSINVEELVVQRVQRLPDSVPRMLAEAIIPPTTPSGRPIPQIAAASSPYQTLLNVARGDIVHPTMTGIPMFQRPDLALVPLVGLPSIPLGLIWCAATESGRVRALAAVARRIVSGPTTNVAEVSLDRVSAGPEDSGDIRNLGSSSGQDRRDRPYRGGQL